MFNLIFEILDSILSCNFLIDEKQGTAATQDQGHDEDKKSDMNFQDFAHKYFDDDEVDYYHGEHSSNDQVDEIKQHNLPSEVAGTSHHDASGLKDRSFFTGEGIYIYTHPFFMSLVNKMTLIIKDLWKHSFL